MSTTSFTQIIGTEALTLTIPVNRVETIVDRIDVCIERNQLKKALEIANEWVGGEVVEKRAPAVTSNRGEAANALIESNRDKGRSAVIKILTTDLGITYANAFYYVKKAGL